MYTTIVVCDTKNVCPLQKKIVFLVSTTLTDPVFTDTIFCILKNTIVFRSISTSTDSGFDLVFITKVHKSNNFSLIGEFDSIFSIEILPKYYEILFQKRYQ